MRILSVTLGFCISAGLAACGAAPAAPPAAPTHTAPAPEPAPPPAPRTWDVDLQGVPRITTHLYIDLRLIPQVSRFRSGVGHDYWDDFERCRSLKHYFMTPHGSAARDIPIYAPFTGTIARTIQEWAGVQIHITSQANPAFMAVLFHVNPSIPLVYGSLIEGGARVGTHIGDQTMSDIAIQVEAPGGRRMVSWFDTMSDQVFDAFRARGATSRDQFVISRAERDAAPLVCNGEAFVDGGSLPNWVNLR